jgi:DTW domain-containing protein YfiP
MAETDAPTPDATIGSDAECPRCGKPTALCVCEGIEPIDNRVGLLILQHPQEQDRELGTARLTVLHLKRATMKVGLSWPSLAKALGREVDPKRWAVLYLGAASAATLPKDREITLIDSKGAPLPEQDRALAAIEGVVVLDGSWSQAKTMWWRNAWVLKCRRLALNPKQPSRYGKLRREPRREGLSTLEAAALALSRLGRQPEIETALGLSFGRLLNAYRSSNTRAK